MKCSQCQRVNPTKAINRKLQLCHTCEVKKWIKNNYLHARELSRKYDRSEKGKAKRRLRSKVYRQKFKDKISARAKLYWKIKRGEIVKRPCFFCGEPNVEAHHPDYSKPYNVLWLCLKHHRPLHGQTIYG